MKKTLKFILLTLGILVLSACSSKNPAINVSVLTSSFEELKEPTTFSILNSSSYSKHPIATLYIKEAIQTEFENKGYVITKKDKADFYVAYHLNVKSTTELEILYKTITIPNALSTSTITVPSEINKVNFDEGRLIIDIIEPNLSKVVWRGLSEGRTYSINDPVEGKIIVNEAISAILETFSSKESVK